MKFKIGDKVKIKNINTEYDGQIGTIIRFHDNFKWNVILKFKDAKEHEEYHFSADEIINIKCPKYLK